MADLEKVAELIEEQGKAWEEFKKSNDARLKVLEAKGYVPDSVQEETDRINKQLGDLTGNIAELQRLAARPDFGNGVAKKSAEMEAYENGFSQFLRKGLDSGLRDLQQKAMNSGSDPNGGYLILPEMDMTIDRVATTMGGLATLANVINVGTAKWTKLVKVSGMSMRRVKNGATGGETTEPTYAEVTIDVHTAEVEPWVDNETLEDAFINLEQDLADEAAIGFGEGANSEYVSGNGVGKCWGILSYNKVANASYSWGNIGYVPSGATSDFASSNPGDKLINLQHALKAQYRPGAAFIMNDATLAKVRQFKDASGNFYLWNPDPAAGFGGRILGSPVVPDDNMPDVGTGAYAVAYGNFKRGYTIVNRAGTSVIRDPYTGKGVTKFNFRRRFGGGVTNFEAIKLMKFATS